AGSAPRRRPAKRHQARAQAEPAQAERELAERELAPEREPAPAMALPARAKQPAPLARLGPAAGRAAGRPVVVAAIAGNRPAIGPARGTTSRCARRHTIRRTRRGTHPPVWP